MKLLNLLFVTGLLLFALSCNKEDDPPDGAGSDFGKITSAVIIVNPVINEGSTTTIESGTQREGVTINSGDLDEVATDSTGVSIIKDLPTGTVPLNFLSGMVDLTVYQEKELYDVVVSYSDTGVAEIIPAVRYQIGGDVIQVEPGDDLQEAVHDGNVIVYLAPGNYDGDLNINSRNVLLFGSYDDKEGYTSFINGTLTVNGSNVRLRGVNINDMTTVNANDFSASFCVFNNANISGNLISLIHNVFNGTSVSVPSGNAVLLDNKNLP